MLVTKAPLRVSFFGGGSDIQKFYNERDGLCVSTTINSYIHLAVNYCNAKHIKVVYSAMELETDVENIKHDRVRECLKLYGITSNIEICSFTDFTVKGTGLGASSAFTVALIKALHYIKYGQNIQKEELAENACYIEIERCGDPIGKQDQYASAFGGFKQYSFTKNDVIVKPVAMEPSTKIELEDSLLFWSTGIGREAGTILREQQEDSHSKEIIFELVKMAKDALEYLYRHELDNFGNLLHDAWILKSRLPGVANEKILKMYYIALNAGALGGKILGAGGGGFLMMYVPLDKKQAVIEAMKEYERREFMFCNEGASLEYR